MAYLTSSYKLVTTTTKKIELKREGGKLAETTDKLCQRFRGGREIRNADKTIPYNITKMDV